MGKTRNRLVSRRTQAKAAAKVARSAAKRGGPAAKVAGKAAGKAAKRGGPAAAKAAKRGGPVAGKALKAEGRRRARRGSSVRSSSGSSSGTQYSKYGLFVLAGLALGVLLGRRGASDEETGTSSSFSGTTGQHSPDEGSPAGQRGETYYSGTSLGTAGGATESTSGEDTSEYQQPGDPNVTGSFREYSDPSAGPLIGGGSRPEMDVGTGQLEEVEQRIRSRIGEDERTHNLPRVNVEVNGDVAELRGVAPSEEVKEAFGEIAADTEGVNEVRNLLTVDPSVGE